VIEKGGECRTLLDAVRCDGLVTLSVVDPGFINLAAEALWGLPSVGTPLKVLQRNLATAEYSWGSLGAGPASDRRSPVTGRQSRHARAQRLNLRPCKTHVLPQAGHIPSAKAPEPLFI
jgi:hypothetical protein